MRAAIGVLLVIFGVVFGVWAGFWWAFVGGIVNVIDAFKAPELIALDVAIGIAKVLFAGAIGGISVMLAVIPGLAILKTA